MELFDTHTHPHMDGYELPLPEFFQRAQAANVAGMVCVGTDADNSEAAINLAANYTQCYASVGLHPHAATQWQQEQQRLSELAADVNVVAIGECGLDYYYLHAPVEAQRQALAGQLEIALMRDLPVIFHIRSSQDGSLDAFKEVWQIVDEVSSNRGQLRAVVHSFTSDAATMEACVARGWYIGLNGIMTFTKDEAQLQAAAQVPLERLVLETDSPFLTPVPFRGKVNDSGQVRTVAEFLSELRQQPLEELAMATTRNAKELFQV